MEHAVFLNLWKLTATCTRAAQPTPRASWSFTSRRSIVANQRRAPATSSSCSKEKRKISTSSCSCHQLDQELFGADVCVMERETSMRFDR